MQAGQDAYKMNVQRLKMDGLLKQKGQYNRQCSFCIRLFYDTILTFLFN